MFRNVVLSVIIGVFCLISPAFAQWDYHGDYAGSVESGLFVGANTEQTFGEYDLQSIQISGTGRLLPPGRSSYQVDFRFEGSTWDSYVPEVGNGDDTGTGYLDVFALVLTEKSKGYYWDLPDTLIHPLNLNPDLILANNMHQPWWGGENFKDGKLETVNSDFSFNFTTDPNKEYYLTMFLQTLEDDSFPSWGKISNVNVQVTPEPISSALFLLGAGALTSRSLLLRKKRKVI